MTETPETAPALPAEQPEPTKPVSQVQCDLFCETCGASLFERDVWRTGDTGLLVVTCPRCGKVRPANDALPYRQAWRQRLGVSLMVAWFVLVGGALAITLAVQVVLIDEAVAGRYDTYAPHYYGYGEFSVDEGRTMDRLRWLAPLGVLTGFVGGCLAACGFYHWRWPWHVVLAFVVPVLATVLVWLTDSAGYYESTDMWVVMLLRSPTICSLIIGGLIGIVFGRSIGRFLVRAILPNRSRQFFAFLWRRDGKDVPWGPF